MNKAKTYIYFAQAVTGGNIKIGCSRQPLARIDALMSWSPVPLRMIAFAPGGQKLESRIHLRFSEHWSHHEWFRPAPEIIDFAKIVAERAEIPTSGLPKTAPYRQMPYRAQRIYAELAL